MERPRNYDDYDFESSDMIVKVEFGGYRGEAMVKRIGKVSLRWEITLRTGSNDRSIATWEGPEVHGDGLIIPSQADIENAQHDINEVIERYLWDPMS